MNSQSSWGVIAFACVAALILIGGALYVTLGPSDPASIVAENSGSVLTGKESNEAWRTALEAIASTTANNPYDFRAPKELSKTEAVSQELVATYIALKSENKLGTEEAATRIQELIVRNVSAVEPSDTYTLASIKATASVTLEDYAGSIGEAMQKSSLVNEYELTTFARTAGLNITTGSPELALAASIYRGIEKELLSAPVPTAIAPQHLELIKSIAFLAQVTERMAGWSGDPIDGLAYIDGFVTAEKRSRAALDALFEAMIELEKKS